MPNQREKIEFKQGVPVVTKLYRTDSKEVEGKKGPQYMRILDDDQRILFADPELELAIVESGAAKDDVIRIIKRGSNGSTTWDVGIVSQTHGEDSLHRRSRPAPAQPGATSHPQPPAAPARKVQTEALEMAEAYCNAIEALKAADEYATAAGVRDLRLITAEAVRAIAVTIYIGRQKAGR